MWSDLVLLAMANAVIVPHLTSGPWLVGALAIGGLASIWVHAYWYHPPSVARERVSEIEARPERDIQDDAAPRPCAGESAEIAGDHMWPAHVHGSWWRDLSWSGWAHVVYVTGELALLLGFVVHVMPPEVVIFVAAILTIHVPIGLLQPRWFKTGHIATIVEQPLLAPLLVALWAVTVVKL
jgi:hypothetical protein